MREVLRVGAIGQVSRKFWQLSGFYCCFSCSRGKLFNFAGSTACPCLNFYFSINFTDLHSLHPFVKAKVKVYLTSVCGTKLIHQTIPILLTYNEHSFSFPKDLPRYPEQHAPSTLGSEPDFTETSTFTYQGHALPCGSSGGLVIESPKGSKTSCQL